MGAEQPGGASTTDTVRSVARIQPDRAGEAEPARILVVDDDPMIRAMVSAVLTEAGLVVVRAADLGQARRQLASQPVELVLLDILLPDGSGLELCEWLRDEPRFAHLPVIVLTGLDQDALITSAFEAGATDFLRKPIEGEILVHRIRFALRAGRVLRSLEASEASLAEAQRIARIGAFEFDPDTGRLVLSEAALGVLGLAQDGRLPDPRWLLGRISEPDLATLTQAHLDAVGDPAATQLSATLRFRTPGRGQRTLQLRSVIERTPQGQPQRIHGTLQDITIEQRRQQAVEFLANHDPGTGLLNRAGFERLTFGALESTARRGGRIAVVHVGYERAGGSAALPGGPPTDQTVRQLAERLRGSVTDGAGRGAEPLTVGRWDDHTLALVLDDIDGPRDALDRAEAAVGALLLPAASEGLPVVVSPRAGVAVYPEDGDHVQLLQRHANEALRSLTGDTRVQRYDPRFTAAAEERFRLEQDLRAALEQGRLELHYQPQFTADRTVVAAEALLRWHHPTLGWVPPGRFIPLAEETGLIRPLGAWVIEEALTERARWAAAGLPPVRVSINLSAVQFGDPALAEDLAAALERHGLQGADVELEVTESLLLGGSELVRASIDQLKATGIRLALDDFGTGYSSLSYLTYLDLDQLKIDRSFVAALHEPGPRAVVRTIIALARGLGLGVVAEGVETEAQARFLLAEGCDLLQGYLLARPEPAVDLRSRLASRSGAAPAG